MKDRILKLCKRLKNCTLNDITQLMDIEPSVLEMILLFLINENKIQEKDGIYSVIEELPTKNGINPREDRKDNRRDRRDNKRDNRRRDSRGNGRGQRPQRPQRTENKENK